MSVLGPGKISGHSGTAQKYRKAFKDARALQKKKARIFGGRLQQNLGHDQKWEGRNADHRKNKSIQLIVMLIGVLCLLVAVFGIYNASDFSSYQTELMEQEETRQNRQKEEGLSANAPTQNTKIIREPNSIEAREIFSTK
jgi:hypothetical protein